MTKVNFKEVTASLGAQGLHVDATEDEQMWRLSFEMGSTTQRVLLLLPPEGTGYFLATAFIDSPKLQGPFEALPMKVLRTVLKTQNESWLAKFFSSPARGQTVYAAVSACSTDDWNGEKLRNRLYACSKLAVRIREELATLP
jgi:hypothetical protein